MLMFSIPICRHGNTIWCRDCRPGEYKKEVEHRKKMKKIAKEFTKKMRKEGFFDGRLDF